MSDLIAEIKLGDPEFTSHEEGLFRFYSDGTYTCVDTGYSAFYKLEEDHVYYKGDRTNETWFPFFDYYTPDIDLAQECNQRLFNKLSDAVVEHYLLKGA